MSAEISTRIDAMWSDLGIDGRSPGAPPPPRSTANGTHGSLVGRVLEAAREFVARERS